jgi:hypothetical protein
MAIDFDEKEDPIELVAVKLATWTAIFTILFCLIIIGIAINLIFHGGPIFDLKTL